MPTTFAPQPGDLVTVTRVGHGQVIATWTGRFGGFTEARDFQLDTDWFASAAEMADVYGVTQTITPARAKEPTA